ncbi:EcsC family protein [Brachybacterium sp. p3-SID1565]|uniref:EcsC family protein n=1 Tax=Brachybacterium sp. p3-SID1565 TaxID=2916046 RepID=UPI0021A4594E|nr:EcsC family protein [Brachybacterium sp. p3-SID1565]MCT1384542.1 EcsC family protein [Brachybacterium sp. p3-SID1565]
MGIFGFMRRDEGTKTTRSAMKEVRRDKAAKGRGKKKAEVEQESGGALQRMVESFRDIGLDGKLNFSSAQTVADRALKRSRKNPEKAARQIIRSHRRGVTVGGFATGLGGVFTLAALLPANVFEFYVQATRMVGAIAAVRGYDLEDEEVRTRVLAALVGEESDDILASVGLGPVAGAATRQITKRLPASPSTAVAGAIGGRVVRRFGLRSTRLFGKAIPGLGGVIGAWGDRRALKKIAETAKKDFPQV